MKRLVLLLSALCLTASVANAQNLLSNADMELDGSTTPTDWTGWSWNGAWANYENPGWGNGTMILAAGFYGGGGAGFFQIVPATAGISYTLSVDSGADAWFLPTGRMEMFFLDASTNIITSATRTTVDPLDYASGWPPVAPDDYDIPHPWQNYSLSATSPDGTALIKVEFSNNETSHPDTVGATGMVGFDNALLVIPEPATTGLVALGSVLLVGYRLRRKH